MFGVNGYYVPITYFYRITRGSIAESPDLEEILGFLEKGAELKIIDESGHTINPFEYDADYYSVITHGPHE